MRFAGLLRRLPNFLPVLKVVAACLLFSHGTVFSQGMAAPAAPASVATGAVTLPKTIPFKQDSAPSSGDGGPSLTAIAAVLALGLVGFSLWAWRHRRRASGVEKTGKRSSWWGGASSRDVLLHGTTRLSPKHSVHDIEWQGRRMLIGCTDQTVALLSERAVAEPPTGSVAQSHPFPSPQEGRP